MDAIVARIHSIQIRRSTSGRAILLVLCCAVAGCEGKSLVDDNPVFAEAPPRGSLTNKATIAVTGDQQQPSTVHTVSSAESVGQELTGNSIVATVNGNPIFLDDLIGSLRLSVEADSRITPEQRQKIYFAQVQGRLPSYIEQEIVLHHLRQAIPADRQAVIDKTLEEPFQEVISNIKKDRKVESDRELNDLLANEGLSIDLLRESFVRIQKVQGYLQTLVPAPKTIDRIEMVEYYQTHKEEFTNDERVRWQEIVVLFSRHGGQAGAEAQMAEVVKALEEKADFGEIATKYSDSLSAERRGDMGWLEVGGLADKELEQQLFSMKSDATTQVYTRDDRLEIYRVVDHQRSQTTPFNEVQTQIEKQLKQEASKIARQKALEDLRNEANVITMFDDETAAAESQTKQASFEGTVPITR
jgi:hypothetical protein